MIHRIQEPEVMWSFNMYAAIGMIVVSIIFMAMEMLWANVEIRSRSPTSLGFKLSSSV